MNGVLHGDNCSIVRNNGDTYSGRFEHGDLNGLGKVTTESGDFTIGDFCFGESHGHCTSYYKDLGVYTGYYTWGMRSGKGELRFEPKEEFGNDSEDPVPSADEIDTSKIYSKFKRRFCGYMIADLIASGGLQVNSENGVPKIITRRVEGISRQLDLIGKKIYRRTLRRRRDKEKLSYMETHVRQDIGNSQLHEKSNLIFEFSEEKTQNFPSATTSHEENNISRRPLWNFRCYNTVSDEAKARPH